MLISAMFIWGTIGIFRKYIPLPSSTLAFVRGFIGTIFLILLILVKREKIQWSAVKANLFMLIASGAFIGFNWILLFESYRYTSVATATLCYYMAPIIVILASPFILREKLTVKKLICVAVALSGMVLVSGVIGVEFTGAGEFKGIFFGLGAALFYATVMLMNQKIRNIPAYDKTIMQLASAAIVVLPYTLLTEDLTGITYTPFIILMILILGIVHTGIAYALYFGSMDNLKAQTIALFSYIDPITAIILSATLLREGMGAMEAVGAVLVLGATIVSELPEKKK
ncbi:MAG: EamA family transporter [Firmicutes bacterium]|nr:EamA family transporter [Bacillota bacterium]